MTTSSLTAHMTAALTSGTLVKSTGGVRLDNPAMTASTLRGLARRGLIGDMTRVLTEKGLAKRRELLAAPAPTSH